MFDSCSWQLSSATRQLEMAKAAARSPDEPASAQAAADSPKVVVKYNIYDKAFPLAADGSLRASEIDDAYCLSYVLPDCRLHLSPSDGRARYQSGATFRLVHEEPAGTFRGLTAGATYHLYPAGKDSSEEAGFQRLLAAEATARQEAARVAALGYEQRTARCAHVPSRRAHRSRRRWRASRRGARAPRASSTPAASACAARARPRRRGSQRGARRRARRAAG